MCKNRLWLVFAAALMPGLGLADSPPAAEAAFAAEAWETDHARAERELFDVLRADGSPRVQVLAGRVHLSDEDANNPLQAKSEDIVARAASLAPGDAFVQSVAASEGRYFNSQCGPVDWPDAEVANLVRLEPDNAAAWRYAVALAHAKGDQAGIDAALERMATVPRAYDHEGEEVALWTQVFSAHPATFSTPGAQVAGAEAPRTALFAALERTSFRWSAADSVLKRACQPDGSTEQDWRRLDWCARAGRVLAREGDSFRLRELGLELLGKGEGHADLQRQQAWLEANASDPSRSAWAHADAPADRERDWQDATGSIMAAEQRLARLGKPATPPEGWLPEDDTHVADLDEGEADAWTAYVEEVRAAMRASDDAREQGVAAASDRLFPSNPATTAGTAAHAASAAPAKLADIARAHPGDPLVQWLAALHAEAGEREAAIARLQRLDPDNAAVWALSLPDPPGAGDPLPSLERMAGSRFYDEYTTGFAAVWRTAFTRVPLPEAVLSSLRTMAPDVDAAAMSDSMALASMVFLSTSGTARTLLGACASDAVATAPARRDPCSAAGRILLHEGRTILQARLGEGLLRKLDALEAVDADRARRVNWWHVSWDPMQVSDATSLGAYFQDWLSTGSEVEAMRLAATRADKAEPPADWQSSKNARVPGA